MTCHHQTAERRPCLTTQPPVCAARYYMIKGVFLIYYDENTPLLQTNAYQYFTAPACFPHGQCGIWNTLQARQLSST